MFALIAALLPGTQAHATPSISDIEAQIDQKWNQLEPLVEQYDKVHEQLQQNLSKQSTLNKELAPLQTKVSLAQTRVGAMSAELYMNGPGSNLNALLESGDPTTLVDEMMSLNQVAKAQQKTVDAVQQQVAKYTAQKKSLDSLVAQQKKQDASLATQKTTINAQISQLQKLRTQAYGSAGTTGGNLKPVPCPYTYTSGSGATAAKKACSLISHPYGWGDAGPTYYDCSGLTMVAWEAAGVSLPHNAAEQYAATRRVSSSQLQIGDLVFYGSDLHHVALYIGNGWVVHAPREGEDVMETKMTVIGTPYAYGRP
ncbi:C40 family peptidase [Rugosimonospora acidiphila]|uniref:C40 family peptidase n=1 Tax=Rugosimonospora acidiphila TaxID=556531 RepID=A0ABP9RHK4_9ACTN